MELETGAQVWSSNPRVSETVPMTGTVTTSSWNLGLCDLTQLLNFRRFCFYAGPYLVIMMLFEWTQ